MLFWDICGLKFQEKKKIWDLKNQTTYSTPSKKKSEEKRKTPATIVVEQSFISESMLYKHDKELAFYLTRLFDRPLTLCVYYPWSSSS